MKLIKRTDDPAEVERLVHVANMVCIVPEAEQLMDLGGQQGCKLFFDPDLPWIGAYTPSLNILRLNPAYDDSSLIVTIAHELRHLWQHSILPITDAQRKKMTPKAAILLTLVQEGDARAFEFYFADAFNNKDNPDFSYESRRWLDSFMQAQEEAALKYSGKAIDYCNGSETISVQNLLDDFGLKKILCRRLDLTDSYWPTDMDIEKALGI